MFMPSNLLFLLFLVLSTLFSVAAPTWFGAWVGLEINLMSIIPLMMGRALFSVESAMKYFLVQAFSSLLFLVLLVTFLVVGSPLLEWGSHLGLLVLIALFIKLGAAPFYQWFPSVISGLGWFAGFLTMTWQKLAPLVLVSYLVGGANFIFLVILASSVVGGLGGLNQSSLRKLMSYSSINHLAWMLLAVKFGIHVALIYYATYTVTSAVLIGGLNYWGFFYLSQLYYGWDGGISKLLVNLNWLSFGGLPPFIGFLPKWLLINLAVSESLHFVIFVMLMMSLFALYYYVRVGFTMLSMSNVMILGSRRETLGDWIISISSVLVLTGLLTVPLAVCYL